MPQMVECPNGHSWEWSAEQSRCPACGWANSHTQFGTGEQNQARPPSNFDRFAIWAKQHPFRAALAGIAVFAVVAGLVVAKFDYDRLQRQNKELLAAKAREENARKRADANFLKASKTVKEMLAEVGAKDLFSIPYFDEVRRKLLEKALESAREFRQQDPDNPQVKRSVAQIMTDAADIYLLMEKPAEATLLLQEAWELNDQLATRLPNDPVNQREQMDVGIKLAYLRNGAGRGDEAEQIYRDIRAQARQLAEACPDDAEILSQRAWIDVNHGWVLLNDPKRMKQGEEEVAQARRWLEKAASMNPAERLHRERLVASWNDVGVFANAQERLAEARDAYREVVSLQSTLAAEAPANRSYASILGTAHRNLARTHGRIFERLQAEYGQKNVLDAAAGALCYAGERAELLDAADRSFQQSEAVFQNLTDQFGRIPQYRTSLAFSLEEHGIFLVHAGQTARGEQLLDNALEMHCQLANEWPSVAAHRANAADIYREKAVFAGKKGQWNEARRNYVQNIHWLEEALQLGPRNARYRNALADALWSCAGADLELRDPLLAANRALAMLHVYPEPEYEFWAAELLGRCIPLTQDENFAFMHLHLCLELTRSWLDKSGESTEVIRQNANFAPLLKQLDFQRMLVGVERERAAHNVSSPPP
jgi:hypothetical protein